MTRFAPVVRLDLPSIPSLLAIVRSTLFALAESSPTVRFTREELDEVSIALQEACTNAVRHAHGLDPDKAVRVEFVDEPDALVVRVIDQGAPFELRDGPPPDPEALAEGGYGMSIMHAWMDDVRLDRVGDRNVLTLRRVYRSPAELEEARHVPAC